MSISIIQRYFSLYLGVIDILSCIPAIVSTAGTNHSKDPLACSSEQCARWTLKALGKTDYTYGHLTHIFQSWLSITMGESLSRWFANMKSGDVLEYK